MASSANVYMADDRTQAKRAELLSLLTSMGYNASYARRAIEKVDVHLRNAAELCFHWMEENPEEVFQKEMSDEDQRIEGLMEPIVNMGFSREQASDALKRNNLDVSKAIMDILGEQANSLKEKIGNEQAVLRQRGDEPVETSDEPAREKLESDGQRVQEAINSDKSNLKSEQEVEALTKQILELQDLVLTYQNKYVDLKRRTRKEQRERNKSNAADDDT